MTRESDDKIEPKAWLGYAGLAFAVLLVLDAAGCARSDAPADTGPNWFEQNAAAIEERAMRIRETREEAERIRDARGDAGGRTAGPGAGRGSSWLEQNAEEILTAREREQAERLDAGAPAPGGESRWHVTPEEIAASLARQAARRLRSARTLRCSFEGFSTDFVFDGIDYDAGTARMVGNAGSAPLGAFMGANGATFIEITPTGNVMTTTVFAWWGADRRYVAVHSRHTAIGGDPIPSQVEGACSALL